MRTILLLLTICIISIRCNEEVGTTHEKILKTEEYLNRETSVGPLQLAIVRLGNNAFMNHVNQCLIKISNSNQIFAFALFTEQSVGNADELSILDCKTYIGYLIYFVEKNIMMQKYIAVQGSSQSFECKTSGPYIPSLQYIFEKQMAASNVKSCILFIDTSKSVENLPKQVDPILLLAKQTEINTK